MIATADPQTAITPRPYQAESIEAGVQFLQSRKAPAGGGLIVIPTGGGKSITIAGIVNRLDGPCLVFQPSREILRQNFEKLMRYGFRPAVYSASLGKKQISGAVTLATIGSVVRTPEHFSHVRYVLIDEAHACNAGSGMYKEFLSRLPDARLCGLTATPYRLQSTMEGSILKFLTRTRPRVFSDMIYCVQNGDLFRDGHLARLEYHPIKGFDRSKLRQNSTGAPNQSKAAYQKGVRGMRSDPTLPRKGII